MFFSYYFAFKNINLGITINDIFAININFIYTYHTNITLIA